MRGFVHGCDSDDRAPHPIATRCKIALPSPREAGRGHINIRCNAQRQRDQLAIALKFLAMCSAPRSDTAINVLVGLTEPSVGNRPPPAR